MTLATVPTATLYAVLTSERPDPQDDIAAQADRASHVTVTVRSKMFSDLTGIIFNGARYDDKVAACDCSQIELFKFADIGYTKCKHGVLSIGHLRRQTAGNGRR